MHRAHYKRLMRELAKEKLRWFTETDISVARDPELLGLMRDAGCQQILIGLESPRSGSLNDVELKANWKAGQRGRYLEAIERIQSFGITVNGCFILGLDGDTTDVFDDVLGFVRESGLYEAQITFLTAFPGTPLIQQMRNEGRLLHDGEWDRCTLFDPNVQPRDMSLAELQAGFLNLAKTLYSQEETDARRLGFKRRLRRSPHFGRRARPAVEHKLAA